MGRNGPCDHTRHILTHCQSSRSLETSTNLNRNPQTFLKWHSAGSETRSKRPGMRVVTTNHAKLLSLAILRQIKNVAWLISLWIYLLSSRIFTYN